MTAGKQTRFITIRDRAYVGEKLRGRMRECRKEIREILLGDDYSCQFKKYVRKEMIIDKENDSYVEVVTDKESGIIIHECREALSEHKGHGSDKRRTNTVTENY